MTKGSSGSLPRIRRPFWIIARHQNKRLEVLTVDSEGVSGGSFLAIFSFEEEAQTYLGLLQEGEKEKKGWSIRETTPGELVSVLLAPCAHAMRVALDPMPPLVSFARAMLPLVSVKRKVFVRYLLEEREEWLGSLVPARGYG